MQQQQKIYALIFNASRIVFRAHFNFFFFGIIENELFKWKKKDTHLKCHATMASAGYTSTLVIA